MPAVAIEIKIDLPPRTITFSTVLDLPESDIRRMAGIPSAREFEATSSQEQEPEWVVNSLGELGVRICDQFYFLYKGRNIVYGAPEDGYHTLQWRPVGKREFGEVCRPLSLLGPDNNRPPTYSEGEGWQELPIK